MKKVLALVLLLSFVFAVSSFAAVSFTTRTGDVQITMPDGKVILVTPKQALPAIPDGASITVLSGTAQISVTGHLHITVVFNGMKAGLDAGDSVKLVIDSKKGLGSFSVISGSVNILRPDGSTFVMNKSSPALEFKAEPYSHNSPLSDTRFMDNGHRDRRGQGEDRIQREESLSDISPIR